MKKRKKGRKLHRERDQRKALLKHLFRALILDEKIKTTEAKAKEMVGLAERFITRAKTNDLSSRRYLLRFFTSSIVKKLMDNIAPRYVERKGGYTRIVKLGQRKSDGAKMVIVEFVKEKNTK